MECVCLQVIYNKLIKDKSGKEKEKTEKGKDLELEHWSLHPNLGKGEKNGWR